MPPGGSDADILARLVRLEAKGEADGLRLAGQAALLARQSATIADQAAAIARQALRIVELERRLSLDSRNSSKPPSSDGPGVAPRSLRRKSGKPPGGQYGHPPRGLGFVADPDRVVAHRPEVCGRCGEGLLARPMELVGRHQVFDVPPVEVHVTEHRRSGCTCACGHRTLAARPAGVPACPASYGARVRAFVAYLSARHYLPVARLAELLGDLVGVRVSTGTIAGMLARTAESFAPTVARIKAHIARAAVVGSDETTLQESGKRIYAWVWHTDRAAYLARGPGRGAGVHRREFPGGLPGAALVTDRLAAQLLTPAAAKQTCVPHLLRGLNGLAEAPGSSWWPDEIAGVLAAICARGRLGAACPETERAELEEALALALDDKYAGRLPRAERTLWRKLRDLGAHALTLCLYRADVPADNSRAGRLLRGIKVKQKVSNQLRSVGGTEALLTIRSVIDTALMQGVPPIRAITEPGRLSF